MRDLDVPTRVFQQTCLRITAENLDLIAVPASHKQEFPIGSDREIPRMNAGILIADVCQQTSIGVLAEYG